MNDIRKVNHLVTLKAKRITSSVVTLTIFFYETNNSKINDICRLLFTESASISFRLSLQ